LNDAVTEGLRAAVPAVARDAAARPSKRLRARLALGAWALGDNTRSERAVAAAVIVELLHLASLFHDDVIDDADTRRGVAALQCTIGKESAIVTGLTIVATAYDMARRLGEQAAWRMSSCAAMLAEGEILDCDRAFDVDFGFEDYLAVARKKTGALFALACWLGAHAANLSELACASMYRFGETLGIAYQVADDCADFRADKTAGKPCGADWAAGVYGAPIVLALARDTPQAHDLRRFLRRYSVAPDELPVVGELVVEAGGFTDAAGKVDELIALAATKLGAELGARDRSGLLAGVSIDIGALL
jgi:geranylgeranyl pyrophosphate synthase